MLDGLDIGVGHQQRLAEKREAPRRDEQWARDAVDLVARRIEHGDLVRADQPHIQVARLRECEPRRLGGSVP